MTDRRDRAQVVTRFAPSPTGPLHLGHALSAALGHALARQTGGRWLVRIDDLDPGRCRPEFEEAIATELAWLGLVPDAPFVRQSASRTAHAEALGRLARQRLLYACTCTRADMAAAIAAPHAGERRGYDGRCRGVDPSTVAEAHALRLDLRRAGALVRRWTEYGTAQGHGRADLEGDPVLRRKDGTPAYHLATVVDDAAAGVSLVVRGEDLGPATALQRLLQELLGLPAPAYFHHPLMRSGDGRRLSKRDGAQALAALRRAGVDGAALARDLVASHQRLLCRAIGRMEAAGQGGDTP